MGGGVMTQNDFPFWKDLTSAQQNRLERAAKEEFFKAGTILHSGADDCSGLFLVRSGRLRAYIISEEGKELTLYRLLERDMCLFSASCVMNNIQFQVMVAAEEDTLVLHIPAEVYRELMEVSLAVSNYTSRLMASRFTDVMWLMDQVLYKKMDTRIAAFLLEEAQLTGREELKLTHEQIANHLGSAREVVSRLMKHFQEDGLVTLKRGSVVLNDLEGLEELAEGSLR